jgi:Domain of unknown function (DUF5615)
MARFYTNENFPFPVVEILRQLGHDVLTIQETGRANEALLDEEVLAFAVSNNRILVTLNRRHFIRLHQEQPSHTGIIVCSLDPDFERLAVEISSAVANDQSLAGVLIRINRPS